MSDPQTSGPPPSTPTPAGAPRVKRPGSDGNPGAPPAASGAASPEFDEAAFERALDALEEAPGFAKSRYQTEVFRLATAALESADGLARLRRLAPRFDAAGVFHGGPWEHVDRLLPELVGSGLRGEGVYPTLEALSELRLLAIAAGEAKSEAATPEEARDFLRQVIGLNLDLLFGDGDTEESRLRPRLFERARRLIALVHAETPAEGLGLQVLSEIEQRAAQRPIQTAVLHRLIELAKRIPDLDEERVRPRLDEFIGAVGLPTALAAESGSLAAYREKLRGLPEEAVEKEAARHGRLLQGTGLSNGYHAVLLRHVRRDPGLLCEALGLGDAGRADLEQSTTLVRSLVSTAIHPATCEAIHGLSRLLERSLLTRPDVSAGLEKLIDLDLRSEVRALLLDHLPRGSGVTANGALLAGAVSILGLPLGIGQGANPTCVAARALSLWSQHAPGYLLELVVSAARDGTIEMPFEGQPIASHQIAGGLAGGAVQGAGLDPISRVLVPHLDRIYDEMMKRASMRGEDPHKWVNPALYGRWVPNGFASTFDLSGRIVVDYPEFLRLFFATHHPSYADDAQLIYPNPVGLLITDVHGNLLGYHAVSILRVASDGEGELRVYFYNPNDEGRQRWGRGVEPTVRGHGEEPGESSLPFEQFAAHLYAFHYNPYEVGDGYAVSEETIASIEAHVRETWGRDFTWR